MPPEVAGEGSSPTQADRKRIEHILKCALDAELIVGGEDAVILGADMVRTRALVNCFTEIGEAAARLTPSARSRVGSVPWRQIVGMRNIVVHVYWGIDVGELVKTVRDDLPLLVDAIRRALDDWADAPGPSAG